MLVLDYDGTIAVDGRADPQALEAIAELRRGGRTVVLATGRRLVDLRCCLGRLDAFDAVVAEEGALISFPRSGSARRLVEAPPAALLDALRARAIPHEVGQCLVECEARHARRVLELLHQLELPLTIHFNRGRMMVVPQSVSKAGGLREALRALRLSAHNAIAIGDAENDHELLAACELGVAVAWGSPALRRAADTVLEGGGPAAVASYLRRLADEREVPVLGGRRKLLLGHAEGWREAFLEARGRSVLVAGDPSSGKSWLAGLLAEQLVLQGYGLCVIDTEGDYGELGSLPGVEVLGGTDELPSGRELSREFAHPDASVVIDLSQTPHARRTSYVAWLLEFLHGLRERTGLPHRIVLDEAHYYLREDLPAERSAAWLQGILLVTYKVSELAPQVQRAGEAILVSRETDAHEVELLHRLCGGSQSLEHWRETLASLELDEAALLPGPLEAGGKLQRFHMAPRLTHHVRHEHKYLDAPLDEELAFRFETPGAAPGRRARSLREFAEILDCARPETLDGHLRRGDFSRWVGEVFRDGPLRARLAELEDLHRLGRLADVNGALVHAVRSRYRSVAEHERPAWAG